MDDPYQQGRAILFGAAGMILRDEHRRVLLVKPHYKPVWQLPGGHIDPDESPREAAERETAEEVGLKVAAGRLLVVDYRAPSAERASILHFVFDGGTVSARQLESVVPQAEEIEAWRAVTREEALTMVKAGGPASRLAQTFAALDSGLTAYLEDGRPI
jgi:ADP-ribose pyrophosphatase YjhB (NUDIX family)